MHNVTLGTNMSPEVPVIGNDVFIGCGASILGGVHVGDGARIAANSLVINDVPPGSFVAGVPAKAFPAASAGGSVVAFRDPRTDDAS
jgi:serine O-acetyltransferase